MPLLDREEYIEQAYFFQSLAQRLEQGRAIQELMVSLKEEILSTTRLPMAIDFLVAELKLKGVFAPAMRRLKHYFTAFQTFVIEEAENERSRFDFTIAARVLEHEAAYRAQGATPQGAFLYQFEAIARNRLGYDRGLAAMAEDPIYDDAWREFILQARSQLGLVDVADLIYVRSQLYYDTRIQKGLPTAELPPVLFSQKEGKIALANRRKDPLLLFAALQRHLNYPRVPRPTRAQKTEETLPALVRRMEKLEARIRLLEEEQRGGIDITRFYAGPEPPPPPQGAEPEGA